MKFRLVICLVIWYNLIMQASGVNNIFVRPLPPSAHNFEEEYWTDNRIQAWLHAIYTASLRSRSEKRYFYNQADAESRRSRLNQAKLLYQLHVHESTKRREDNL